MDKTTFDRIVNLLIPLMGSVAERQAFVGQALYDASSLIRKISFEGNASQFTVNLVRECDQFGQIASGKLAIVALLEQARQHVGLEQQRQIDRIIANLTSSSSGSRETSPLTMKVEKSKQNWVMKILRDPAFQAVVAVISVIIAVIALIDGNPPPSTVLTATKTDVPTQTIEASSTPHTPTATPTSNDGCTAIVDPSSPSSVLNVVRQFPNRDATIVESVQRGQTVVVLEKSAGDDVFYRIQSGNRTIGWIAEQYLDLSANCP